MYLVTRLLVVFGLVVGLLGCGDDDGGNDSGPSGGVDGSSGGIDGGGTSRDAATASPEDAGSVPEDAGSEVSPGLDVQAVGSTMADLGRSAIGAGQLSGDGSCYVFQSGEADVTGGGDLGTQVYLLDIETGLVELVSRDHTGSPAATRAAFPQSPLGTYVSDDCRYIVFSSRDALSDAPEDVDTYDGTKVYLRDRENETTELLSFVPGPSVSAGCDLASMSGDGASVLFRCNIEGRNHAFVNPQDLYLWSRSAGTARYLDIKDVDGADLSRGYATELSFLSPGGRYAVSRTDADLVGLGASGNAWLRVDTADASWAELPLKDESADGRLSAPSMSVDADVTEVLYATTDQVLDGTDPTGAHLYLLDVEAGTRQLITADMAGMPTMRVNADHVRMSRDGQLVVLELGDLGFAGGETDYTSDAAVLWNRNTSEWTILSRWLRGPDTFLGDPYIGRAPTISADGSSVVFQCEAEAARNEPPAQWMRLCRWRASR